MLFTICDDGMRPGNPFRRKGNYSIAVLKLRCHDVLKESSHPNECRPKNPERKEVEEKKAGVNWYEKKVVIIKTSCAYPILKHRERASRSKRTTGA